MTKDTFHISKQFERISVIIPSWNAKDYLHRCIDSLLGTTKQHELEVIVVDNGSADGSIEMVTSNFDDVIVIANRRNLGFAKACNIGIRQATGTYYALVNSDIVVAPDCLDLLCKYLRSNADVGLLGPKVLFPDGSLQQTTRAFPSLWNSYCRALALDKIFPRSKLFAQQFMSYWAHDSARSVDFLSGCLLVTRASTVKKIGVIDERYFIFAEDKDWARRFWNRGYKVVYYPEAIAFHHHFASASRDPARFYVEEIRANLQYWRKHHGKFKASLYAGSVLLHQVLRILKGVAEYFFCPIRRTVVAADLQRTIRAVKWLLRLSTDLNQK